MGRQGGLSSRRHLQRPGYQRVPVHQEEPAPVRPDDRRCPCRRARPDLVLGSVPVAAPLGAFASLRTCAARKACCGSSATGCTTRRRCGHDDAGHAQRDRRERVGDDLSAGPPRAGRERRAGLAHAHTPYGYRRNYDRHTKAFLSQDPDVLDGNGRAIEDSPAGWCGRSRAVRGREAADTLLPGPGRAEDTDAGQRIRMAAELTATSSATPPTSRSGFTSITMTAVRAAAAGALRAIRDGVEAQWPPLIDEETFWAVQRVLTDASRRTTDALGWPARTKYLMSHIAKCGRCGASMARNKHHSAGSLFDRYVCGKSGHLSVRLDQLDWYAKRVMKRWLSDPDVYATLRARRFEYRGQGARGDRASRTGLESLFREQKAGLVSARAVTVVERRIGQVIAEARQREQAAALRAQGQCRPACRGNMGQLDLAVKRQIIRATADITIYPIGSGRGGIETLPKRVAWVWKLGTGADDISRVRRRTTRGRAPCAPGPRQRAPVSPWPRSSARRRSAGSASH